MEETNTTSDPQQHRADELLPPVQPPAARFFMQLFFIPLLIVSVIVGVWLTFSWMANRGSQPTELVDHIERLNHASWQKALTLANTIRDPRYADLRVDHELASHIADLLNRQLASDYTDRDHVWLQIYLCRVLGEFNIDDGLPALILAAKQDEEPVKTEVRRAALQAISLLIERIGPEQALANDQLVPALIAVAQTPDRPLSNAGEEPIMAPLHRLRSAAAYALGLLDTPASREQLAAMLDDAAQDVRNNAAIGLARLGDTRAEPVLREMLNPSDQSLMSSMDQAGVAESEKPQWLTWKRELIVSSALKAFQKLMEAEPLSDPQRMRTLVSNIATDQRFSQQVQAEARSIADKLAAPDGL